MICVTTRLPIQCGLLELLLFEIERLYYKQPQPFLEAMYKALFALGYYGMMRVGELTLSEHVLKAKDVHMATNKEKLLLVLYSSKTHSKGSRPQKIKITSNRTEKSGQYCHRNFCPFKLLRTYIDMRGNDFTQNNDPFFIFKDGSSVKAENSREILRQLLERLGLDGTLYNMHSLRIGRTTDLIKYNYSFQEVKRMGRWRSNAVYKYIRDI